MLLVFEVVCEKVRNFLEKYDIRSSWQYEFWPDHPIEAAVYDFLTNTYGWLYDEKCMGPLCSLTCPKHSIALIENLFVKNYIQLEEINFWNDYNPICMGDSMFWNGWYTVELLYDMKLGVVQGSVLDPFIFSLFLHDLPPSITVGKVVLYCRW